VFAAALCLELHNKGNSLDPIYISPSAGVWR
jgi:hypothetical protein